MAITIGHASKDERGKSKNGAAGDQTKQEVFTRKWYAGDWDFVIRFKDSKQAEKAAVACEQACKNNAIGYDQTQRNTLYTQAKAVNYNLSKITKKCECDCSALMCVCAIAAGVDPKYLYIGNNLRVTGNMRSAFKKIPGVQILTASKYLTSDQYLKRGDILVKENRHTVMALENGAKVSKSILTKPSKVTMPFTPYLVRVNTDALNIRKGAGVTFAKVGVIKDRGVYTIVKEKKNGLTTWGLLKSGAEKEDKWISLTYTKKVK